MSDVRELLAAILEVGDDVQDHIERLERTIELTQEMIRDLDVRGERLIAALIRLRNQFAEETR